MSSLEQYADNFSAGKKVEIHIPLPYAKMFRDWAVIKAMDNNLITLQLSRDILPAGVCLRVGQMLELKNNGGKGERLCHAVVVGKEFGQELNLLLTDDVVPDEPREFYRINVFLPIICCHLKTRNPLRLGAQWEHRRKKQEKYEREYKKQQLEKQRRRVLEDEQIRKQSCIRKAGTTNVVTTYRDSLEDNEYYRRWDTVLPLAVNISGGGICFMEDEVISVNEYMRLEIFIPTPRRVIDSVARVVFAQRNFADGLVQDVFAIGLQFVFIDEGDRFALVQYSNAIQRARIRQIQGFNDLDVYDQAKDAQPARQRLSRRKILDSRNIDSSSPTFWSICIREAVLIIAILCLVSLLSVFYTITMTGYSGYGIADIFEHGIKKYQHTLNK